MRLFLILLSLILSSKCFSQSEFNTSQNGLIYSDSAISKLKFVVDSLNLKFKYCDLNKSFRSNFLGQGHFISIQGKHAEEAKNDLDNNISYSNFTAKYNKAEIEENLVVSKYYYTNWNNEISLHVSNIRLNKKYPNYFDLGINDKFYETMDKGHWIYKYYPKLNDSEGGLDAFYLIEGFTQSQLPEPYALMVMYADCLVDTNTTIFFNIDNREENQINDTISEQISFMKYLDSVTLKPRFITNYNDDIETFDKNWEHYIKKMKIWDSLRFNKIDSLRQFDPSFSYRFMTAIEDAKNNSNSDDEFEEYVSYYIGKKTALELKRSRQVIGGCSQDLSPRIHALNIAKLSAETFNWEIFLRSHLDIMNDNFDRVSDGNYAWSGRKTYIKELEVLDIDVIRLLFGISFQIDNPSTNHYFSNINRTGRAFADFSDKDLFEEKVSEIIVDEKIDILNRINFYFLFDHYRGNLADKNRQIKVNEKLKILAKTFPEYIYLELIKE